MTQVSVAEFKASLGEPPRRARHPRSVEREIMVAMCGPHLAAAVIGIARISGNFTDFPGRVALLSDSGRMAGYHLKREGSSGRWRLAFSGGADGAGDARSFRLDPRRGAAAMALRAMDMAPVEAAMERLRGMAAWPKQPEEVASGVALSLEGVSNAVLTASMGNGTENLRLPGMPETPRFARAWIRACVGRGIDLDGASFPGAPLLRAAARGDDPAVSALLAEGAHVDVRAEDGGTPLMRAATFGHAGTAGLLMAGGAGAALADLSGRTPLHHAVICHVGPTFFTCYSISGDRFRAGPSAEGA